MDANERTACRWGDEPLIRRLAAALTITDPAPPGLQESAGELLAWRTIDADLTELLLTGHAPVPAD